jgi:hypothetical protein
MKNMREQRIHDSDIVEQHRKAVAIEKALKKKFAVECIFSLSGDALRRILPK